MSDQDVMKAVLFDGNLQPAVAMVDRPIPTEGEVLLRVLRAGICGTDLSILSGRHPRARAPLVLGHEVAARVYEMGATARATHSGLQIGDLVTIEPIISCGQCVACRTGVPHVCSSLRLYGIDLPGGMAEFMTVRADRLVPAPQGMSPEMVVLAEPLAVAVHSVRLAGLRYGDSVCVIGGGPIGLLIALVARKSTSKPVLISEPEPSRRRVAEKLGFEVVDPSSSSLEEIVGMRSQGRGIDVVFESAGSQGAVSSATRIARPRGTVVQVSMPKEPRTVSLVELTFKELVLKGVRVYEPFDFEHAIELLQSDAELFAPLLSRPFALDEAADAFEAARSGDKGLRIILDLENLGDERHD